jgi:hypothetical protein
MLPSSKARTAFLVLACQLIRSIPHGTLAVLESKPDLFPMEVKILFYPLFSDSKFDYPIDSP